MLFIDWDLLKNVKTEVYQMTNSELKFEYNYILKMNCNLNSFRAYHVLMVK